jgi:hypothetical protein
VFDAPSWSGRDIVGRATLSTVFPTMMIKSDVHSTTSVFHRRW